MTRKEIEAMKNTLPKWKDGKPPVLTLEQELLSESLSCRSMINSILCYHGAKDIMQNPYLQKYFETLGPINVAKLANEQIEDFSKAKVLTNVYTDSEGLSYNSIIWADEQ